MQPLPSLIAGRLPVGPQNPTLADLGEHDPDRAETRTATALLRLAQHDPAAAAAALAPVLPQGWLARAFLLEAMARDELGDPDAAGRALERALDLTEPHAASASVEQLPATTEPSKQAAPVPALSRAPRDRSG